MASDVRRLMAAVREQGWRIEDKGDKWLCYSPHNKKIVPIHKTPSDHRWMKNAIAELRRGGFTWEGR